jgi:hypothetical protein
VRFVGGRAEHQQQRRPDDHADPDRHHHVERRLRDRQQTQQHHEPDRPPQRLAPSATRPGSGDGHDRRHRRDHVRGGRSAPDVLLGPQQRHEFLEVAIEQQHVDRAHREIGQRPGEHQQQRHPPPSGDEQDDQRDRRDHLGEQLGERQEQVRERVGQPTHEFQQIQLDTADRRSGDRSDEGAAGDEPRADQEPEHVSGREDPPRPWWVEHLDRCRRALAAHHGIAGGRHALRRAESAAATGNLVRRHPSLADDRRRAFDDSPAVGVRPSGPWVGLPYGIADTAHLPAPDDATAREQLNMGRNFLVKLAVFVLILVAINVVAALAGWEFRVPIIGSVILTLIISLVLNLFMRRNR